MIIIGHRLIPFKPLYIVASIDEIKNTPSNSIVLVEFSEQNVTIIRFCRDNGVEFAVFVKDIIEVALANSFLPKFLLVEKDLAKRAQEFANEYLIDAKILLLETLSSEIEFVATNFIDGIIFEKGIVR